MKLPVMRGLVPCILSLLLPGLGQIYNRQYKKGIVLAVLDQAFLFLFGTMHLWDRFDGLITFIVIGLFADIAIAVDAVVVARRKTASPYASATEKPAVPRFALFLLAAAYIFVLNQYATRSIKLKAYIAPTNSMSPTIRSGDRIVAKSYQNKPLQKKDVVVLAVHWQSQYLLVIKRVIAIGGDVIKGNDGKVFLNGNLLTEPYAVHVLKHDRRFFPGSLDHFGPTVIPKGMYFVMGDNRDDSWDSRSDNFGLVSQEQIKAKVLYIYWSKQRSRIGRTIR